MEQARVVVVIPCFNDGMFLEAAVASVRKNEPVDIVVVDDGSTDSMTAAAFERLAAAGVQVEHRENGGPSVARMTALARSTAPYVFPLDADDQIEAGCLGALADALDADPSIAFTYGHLVFTDNVTGGRVAQPWDPFTLLYANRWGSPCLFRRTALEAVGGWMLDDCYEDWDLLLTLAENDFAGAPVDHLVLHYRRHSHSRMNERGHNRHAEIYRELRRRHGALFARRAELARKTGAARWRQIAYPLLLGARPLYPFRVYHAIEALRSRRARRRAAAAPGG